MNNILISIVGPTAIGKTRLAILLAQHLGSEIISSDSRQFFKEMSIGTAVPSKEEMGLAKHHFIQHKHITDNYSVGDFEKEAIAKLKLLFKEKNTVIMVGGSGLYVDAVEKGLNEFPEIDATIRKILNADFKTQGIENLQIRLKELDPDYYDKVDIYNPHRLIRALEVCMGTGKTYSSFLKAPKAKRTFIVLSLGLRTDREQLYTNINERVDKMIHMGLLEEVRPLLPVKDLNALQTVGYKELFKYFDGVWDLDFAIAEIKKNTRRFAKRQLTWFKRNANTLWVDADYNEHEIIKKVQKILESLRNE